MYCIRCGVELEENAEKCPLCETPVPKIENEDMGIYEGEYPFVNINLYELKMKKVKKAVFMSFFTISIISMLEVFFQNIIVYGHIGWAYYVIPSILLFDLMLFVMLNSHSMRQNLFFILVGLTSFLLIIDYGDKRLSWSLGRGIPITLAFCFIGLIFSFVWDKNKKDKIKILNFFLFFVGVFLLILEFIIRKKFSWSIWASIPLFVLNVMLRYAYKSYKEEFERRLQNIFLVNTSFYDLKGEKVYHSLFLGMLIWLRDKYEVKSNGERGHGRYDAMLIPLDKIKPAYIFEFKVSKTIKGLTAKAEEALEQIKEKQYHAGLKEKGISKIYKIGIAFKGKNVKVKYEI